MESELIERKQKFYKELLLGEPIILDYLYISLMEDGRVYINCNPDCNCAQDTFENFDKFWEEHGYLIV